MAQYTFQSNEFALFVDSRIRWLQGQLSHIQAMKILLRDKKPSNDSPQPLARCQKRRSDVHCHQVSWALGKATKEFTQHQQLRRKRMARVALSWMPASPHALSESPLRNAARTSLRAF